MASNLAELMRLGRHQHAARVTSTVAWHRHWRDLHAIVTRMAVDDILHWCMLDMLMGQIITEAHHTSTHDSRHGISLNGICFAHRAMSAMRAQLTFQERC